ncbi:hypothetical protein V3C99_004890 [Haemonchus contortus]
MKWIILIASDAVFVIFKFPVIVQTHCMRVWLMFTLMPSLSILLKTHLCDETHDVNTMTVQNSREIPEDVLRQDYGNVEYQKLKGVESYLDEFARQ